ncbi:MAG: DUF5312 domain-containing protein [Treponemataceae bacterium]|uniref:DUF5312 family protein n=1 Tax=Treponema sp. J25 TaxID=2094121 RepID=UPI0010455059|nr:DUF5312 family protein [Treponema sp. J25]MCX7949323.1 DUF5312 domain-containing protein [Treponemataceae bacterium]TCW61165.1 hypothetical protein C5O22_07900 [Treponema sp. J25]
MALGFIERILSFLTASGDPEVEKKRLLKQIARDLSKHKYRFYKVKGEEAQPLFAKFFYDVYKLVSPAQVFLQNADKSNELKKIVIEHFLDDKGRELQNRLTEEAIIERAKTIPLKNLSQQVNEDLTSFIASFDGEKSLAIEDCYNAILLFVQLVKFDYFFLLKKFDANLAERNFSYKPRFEAIRAEYVVDDIKDFIEVMYPLDQVKEWTKVFEILKTYKGVEVIGASQWQKLLSLFSDIKRTGILELMVRHIEKNPTWQAQLRVPHEAILDPHIQKIKTQVDVTIQRIIQQRRTSKIEELATAIFGTPSISRLKNYTDKANVVFSKKMLGGFIYVQALNYLKAFLLDVFKKDIRELCDLLLVRGQWVSNVLSQQLSESYHELMEVSNRLVTFDDNLADEGDMGTRLRIAMAKADRDKEQIKYVRTLLKGINDEALKLITTAAQDCIVIGKNLKSALEDYQKTPHDLIINWKELEGASEHPIDQRITEVYKKIYYFVQLMQFFVKPE